ncbi:hypothetical protein WSM22_29500 [Cytophagales bacterium WSM2-2]|nr:hypothetical protein WSM22_29500 [Cytophagales bacterium WSM2-2]
MKNVVLVFLILVLFAACSPNDRETVSGQKFTIVKNGDGKEVTSERYLVLNFMFKDSKDSIWYDSRKNLPQVMYKKQINKPGDKLLEVLCMLTKGDSATFKIKADELFIKSFRQQQLPPKVEASSLFTFHFGLTDVLDSAQFVTYRNDQIAKQNELMAKQNEFAIKQQKEQFSKDSVTIDNFLREKNVKAKQSPLGVRYVITKPGTGANAKDGQTATVNYAGHLLNGKYFDTSSEEVAKANGIYQNGRPYSAYPVTLGQHGVIQGWEEVLKLMNKGCKATVYIPSALGYGAQGNGPIIPGNTILVFEMEVLDIK